MISLLTRGLVALLLAAIPILTVTETARADEAECQETYLAEGGRTLFELELRYVPEPLRAFPWDCASRILGESWDDGAGISVAYSLLYTDIDFSLYPAIIAAFERAGWIDPFVVTTVERGDGSEVLSMTAAELADLPSDPRFARSRFSNVATGQNIIELNYADGEAFQNDPALTEPSLLVTVLVSETFATAGIADPSALSGLRTLFDVAPTPAQWGVIGAGSLMLMLVVGWPSSLLNSVVGSRYQAVTIWLRARFRRPKAEPTAASGPPKMSRLPGWLMWPGFAAAAIIGAFVDPDFGVIPMSARLVVTLFASFLLFNLATWAIVRRVARRIQPDSEPYLKFRWGSLALVALAVVVARLLELEPGVIFGLVAGIAYAVTLQASRSAMIVLVGSGIALALALVAWLGYSLLAPVTADTPGNFFLVFLVEFLSGVTIKGVSTLPLALLPLGNLDGTKLLRWKKWAWALAYAVGLAGFMLVLLTIPKAWGEIPGDFLRWLALFCAYFLLAVVVWAVNAWRLAKRPPRAESEQGDQPDAITLD